MKHILLLAALALVTVVVSLTVGMPALWGADGHLSAEQYYGVAIKDAARFVAEQNQTGAQARYNSLAATNITAELGFDRFYKKGDRWLMEVRYLNAGMVRKTSGDEAHRDSYADPVYFEFKVESLSNDQNEAHIVVSQVTREGKPIDARVKHAKITVSRRLKLVSKQYFYRGREEPISAEFSGDRNLPMGFDAFPIELPDFEGSRLLSPSRLAEAAPGDSIWFECHDLFMRKVRVQWKRGELWPRQIKSHNGQARLILMEKAP